MVRGHDEQDPVVLHGTGKKCQPGFFFKEEKAHFSQQLKMINWSSVCPGDEIYKK